MKNALPPFTPGSAIEATSSGALDLRQDVLDGFMAVRAKHEGLQALLHQIIRRVVLPRAKEIGDELARIKARYPSGKKGPGGTASRFYRDCESLTGLKKAQAANYIQLATNWHRLMDYMADLPEGATPVLTLQAAMDAIRTMNKPERPALSGSAVDVAPSKRSRYVHATREKVLPALAALKATPVGLKHQGQLDKILEALHNLLDAMEAAEEIDDQQVVPAPEPRAHRYLELPDPDPAERVSLAAMFPSTAEGLADLEEAIMEAGSGDALGRSLGVAKGVVSNHRQRIRKALG